MVPDSSLGEASLLFGSFVENKMEETHEEQEGSDNLIFVPTATVTVIQHITVQDQNSFITPPPRIDLLRREPQNNDQACQQASQSAEQAARQAQQSASQSIGEAQRSATEAARQASQSASQAIQQAQQTAGQSVDAASRSAAQAVSAASQMVASIQASASQAISRANGSMTSAQMSASSALMSAQSAQLGASSAVLQAGAAVAAATGSAAAAGSSFLAAAAKATQGAQSSAAGVAAAASSQVNLASAQASASQSAAVTATQAALAIVGSIIASALITILIYFLISRHKKSSKRRSKRESRQRDRSLSPAPSYAQESKYPISQDLNTNPTAQSAYQTTAERDIGSNDMATTPGGGITKNTEVKWNPNKPPQAPTLGNWLKVQDGVSPFGSISLPADKKSPGPLGGQLKSPLRSIPPPSPKPMYRAPSPPAAARTPPSPKRRNESIPRESVMPIRESMPFRQQSMSASIRDSEQSIAEIGKATVKQGLVRQITISKSQSVRRKPSNVTSQQGKSATKPEFPNYMIPLPEGENAAYRESKASVWTDDIPDSANKPTSTFVPSPPTTARGEGNVMEIPQTRGPVRTTAEWLDSIRDAAAANQDTSDLVSSGVTNSTRGTIVGGLPSNPRMGGGLPGNPRDRMAAVVKTNQQIQSMEGELDCVKGLEERFGDGNVNANGGVKTQGSVRSRASSINMRGRASNGLRVVNTPGVGRAM